MPSATRSAGPTEAINAPPQERTVDATTAVHAHPRCTLVINMANVRAHVARGLAASILSHMPPFAELGASFDAVRDSEWLVYTGARFTKTPDAVFLLRYSASDAAVDAAVGDLAAALRAKTAADGPPGPSTAEIGGFVHALWRPQSNVLAMVPPPMADAATRALSGVTLDPHVGPTEAIRVRMRHPGSLVPALATSVYEARAWVVPSADGGAELFAEADCPTESEAVVVANEVRREIGKATASAATKLFLRGVLDRAEVTSDGRIARLRIPATASQVNAILETLAARDATGE